MDTRRTLPAATQPHSDSGISHSGPAPPPTRHSQFTRLSFSSVALCNELFGGAFPDSRFTSHELRAIALIGPPVSRLLIQAQSKKTELFILIATPAIRIFPKSFKISAVSNSNRHKTAMRRSIAVPRPTPLPFVGRRTCTTLRSRRAFHQSQITSHQSPGSRHSPLATRHCIPNRDTPSNRNRRNFLKINHITISNRDWNATIPLAKPSAPSIPSQPPLIATPVTRIVPKPAGINRLILSNRREMPSAVTPRVTTHESRLTTHESPVTNHGVLIATTPAQKSP